MVFTPIDAEKIYEKDENLKREDVAALMEWASKTPHLPKFTDLEALLSLHSCYYRMELAKITLDNYFTARTHIPEFFYYDENDTTLSIQFDIIYFLMLPKKNPNDNMILFIKIKDTNADLFNFASSAKAAMMVALLFVYMNGIADNCRLIIDLSGASLRHLAKCSPIMVKNLINFLQEAILVRLKGIYFINLVSFVDRIIQFIKPFMKKELMDIIFFHQNLEEFFKTIPQERMPKEYGGQAGSLDELQKNSNGTIMDNFDFFLKYNEFLVDETKRVGKLNNDLFGMSGSFKQLVFD